MVILGAYLTLQHEHIPKEIKKLIGNKNIITNIYRTEAYDLIMWDTIVLDIKEFYIKT